MALMALRNMYAIWAALPVQGSLDTDSVVAVPALLVLTTDTINFLTNFDHYYDICPRAGTVCTCACVHRVHDISLQTMYSLYPTSPQTQHKEIAGTASVRSCQR